jgi:hypothetical protein
MQQERVGWFVVLSFWKTKQWNIGHRKTRVFCNFKQAHVDRENQGDIFVNFKVLIKFAIRFRKRKSYETRNSPRIIQNGRV